MGQLADLHRTARRADQPDGAHITLAVIARLAPDQKHLIGSMFINFGGPGVSGVDTVRNPASANERAHRQRDIADMAG